MAIVTEATNRIDLFCLEHFGVNDDATRRQFIRWNMEYFSDNPTFWLRTGDDLYTQEPLVPSESRLRIDGEGELLLDSNSRLVV